MVINGGKENHIPECRVSEIESGGEKAPLMVNDKKIKQILNIQIITDKSVKDFIFTIHF